jgi:DNA-binding CsgD family transcriptional regulator
MADAVSAVRAQAAKAAQRGALDRAGQLRKLDPRERRLLELFRRHGTATAAEIAEHLGLAQRTVVGLCRSWLKTGFLELKNPSRKNRSYRLGKAFEFLIE